MTDTLIVGAGLCGLALAEMLETQGREYLLIEGRDRVGGRILSDPVDIGPAWYWPGQPRMAALVERLGLTRFNQFAKGALTFEDQDGSIQRGRGFASMEGSWRVEGGMGAVTDALVARLSEARVRLNTRVTGLDREDGGVVVRTGGVALHARRVVLAVPPRLSAGLAFEPPLPGAVVSAMAEVPTWMAGQAKAVAIYPTPFWRNAGLSGDAMSRRGPMVEIHDASPADGSYGALFGFIGVPPAARKDEAALHAAVGAQFHALFGGDAPSSQQIQDWAGEPFTATAADADPLMAHPAYGLPTSVQRQWEGRVILSGTETAPAFGGYLEGALEAAEAAFGMVDGQ